MAGIADRPAAASLPAPASSSVSPEAVRSYRSQLTTGADVVDPATLLALAAGQMLHEHENPGEATVHVLQGRVRLRAGDDAWDGSPGDLLIVPDSRHTLEALEDGRGAAHRGQVRLAASAKQGPGAFAGGSPSFSVLAVETPGMLTEVGMVGDGRRGSGRPRPV